ncbi:hypothetical protein F2Q69_00003211 [Brassica cretica]|uniref:NADH dehydrogenase [ubiquinone] 1 alpha subcomplex subunit 1 n=5 Tax=Brassica TaxID=3705 RepID=A0ABQ7CJS1_BRACR|nr:hypothetical protein F2Q69_00003211 [Brassica cretica]KAF3552385.1 hypothetical protein DY000_02003869 [Brassica cretica]
MSLVWLEAALPLGIIGGMLCIMGNSQYYIHKAYHGRPKHIGHDEWDVAMERRDKKVVEKAAAPPSGLCSSSSKWLFESSSLNSSLVFVLLKMNIR